MQNEVLMVVEYTTERWMWKACQALACWNIFLDSRKMEGAGEALLKALRLDISFV